MPSGRVTVHRLSAGADAAEVATAAVSGGRTTMPFADWLAELRRLRESAPQRDEWSDVDVRPYYDRGFSPASARAELQFRELASS